MWVLLFLIIIGVIIYVALKPKQRGSYLHVKNANNGSPREAVDVRVSVSMDSSAQFDNPDVGPIVLSEDGGFILNPQSTFPLTIYGIDQFIAVKLKEVLDDGYSQYPRDTVQKVMPIFAQHNAWCREVDEYVKKFRPIYLQNIEKQIGASHEWNAASAMDKKDLIEEFKVNVIDSLDIQPYCNLDILFSADSFDTTIDDALIERFGYEPIKFYLNRSRGVHIVPADHYDRKMFEKLAEMGLALRGESISLPAILEGFKLKEMAALVEDLNPPKFSRKSKAIEYLTKAPDLKERINKIISLRTVFQIQPLPDKFANIDLRQVSMAWRYTSELSELVCLSYMHSGYAMQRRNRELSESREYDFIKGWEIIATDNSCPYCKRAAEKKYPFNNYPITPLHIGCRCSVAPILK